MPPQLRARGGDSQADAPARRGCEFIGLVREVLQSEAVRALIHSLIARINAQAEPLPDAADGTSEQPANGQK
jgi:hypothetical protein